MSSEDVVIGSFSVSVKFLLDGCGPLWLSAVYGPNNPLTRKDFWVELSFLKPRMSGEQPTPYS